MNDVTAEQRKQLYLQRVNQLYDDIKIWLKDEQLVVVSKEFEIVELLGHYQSSLLIIKTPKGKNLAEFRPDGASVILAEGLININGWLGPEYLAYMVNGGPYSFRHSAQNQNEYIKHFFYPTIDADGWYWIEEKLNSEVHFLNKESLFELISRVSLYEI